ncbi:MAG: pyridoxamine 5'-phosphate oxidase family protein, partial [Acidobacteriota bacterium]
EWMRSNHHVCVEVDEVTSREEWMSVIVSGRYEELPDIPEYKSARLQALDLLQGRAVWWWEPACISSSQRDMPHSSTPIAYRIHIDQMTGHRATPNPVESNGSSGKTTAIKRGWLRSLLRV